MGALRHVQLRMVVEHVDAESDFRQTMTLVDEFFSSHPGGRNHPRVRFENLRVRFRGIRTGHMNFQSGHRGADKSGENSESASRAKKFDSQKKYDADIYSGLLDLT